MTTKIDLCRFSRPGRALLLSHGTIVCILIFMSQSGCAEYINIAKSGPGDLEDDRIDVSRISEIIVGETTREQIEAMFGVPNLTLRHLNNESIKKIFTDGYSYLVARSDPRGDTIWGVRPKLYTKRLLNVEFKDDVVSSFTGPEPGAVELLKQLYD